MTQIEKQVKRSGEIALFIAATGLGIMTLISYTTNLLGISFPKNSNIVVNGGQSPAVTTNNYFPHFFGPIFLTGAIVLMVVGIALRIRLSKK